MLPRFIKQRLPHLRLPARNPLQPNPTPINAITSIPPSLTNTPYHLLALILTTSTTFNLLLYLSTWPFLQPILPSWISRIPTKLCLPTRGVKCWRVRYVNTKKGRARCEDCFAEDKYRTAIRGQQLGRGERWKLWWELKGRRDWRVRVGIFVVGVLVLSLILSMMMGVGSRGGAVEGRKQQQEDERVKEVKTKVIPYQTWVMTDDRHGTVVLTSFTSYETIYQAQATVLGG